MNYAQFNRLMAACEQPVILLEGTRALPAEDAAALTAFARRLAEVYPRATFRTGNAQGADSAFAAGVAQVDAARLEYILPYGGHRKKAIPGTSRQIPVSVLPRIAEMRAAYLTEQASPQYAGLLARRDAVPKLRAKAGYLLRDTLKVMGSESAALAPATLGLFYAHPRDPMKGGTGHTIRVCQRQGVPLALQAEWLHWPVM